MQTEGEIQTEHETPKGCSCVARTNEALNMTSPGVKVLIDLLSGRPVVATVRVIGKGKVPYLFATFCPFCGIKYGD